jgi:hypothetical protein
MCGIVGIVNGGEVAPLLVKSAAVDRAVAPSSGRANFCP